MDSLTELSRTDEVVMQPTEERAERTMSDQLAREAKALVSWAFRNGPIENIHAGSRINDAEMKALMKYAVDHVYAALVARENNLQLYETLLRWCDLYTTTWDNPEPLPRQPLIARARR
jgi:hypothetical protein